MVTYLQKNTKMPESSVERQSPQCRHSSNPFSNCLNIESSLISRQDAAYAKRLLNIKTAKQRSES